MTINYIYNSKGKPEYAVVPYVLWESLEKHINENIKRKTTELKRKFNPKEYKGILSHLNLDVEQEIKNMRKEWKRNIS